jgi:hypothetical protein
MVENYICESCSHCLVCKQKELVDKFQEDAKKPLGISITINNCENFEKVS